MIKFITGFIRKYPHALLLLYWPLYGLVFELLEWFVHPPSYHVMYCALDDYIPFAEIFIIPYYYWFVGLIWLHVYTLFKEPEVFRKLMYFVIITQTTALIMFMVYPSMQLLRPEVLPRDNIFTEMVSHIYAIDTNTNVCPSLHVIGGMGVWFASLQCKAFRSVPWRIFHAVSSILVCISTVFLKQHSFVDIPAALIVCAVAYPLSFGKLGERLRLMFRRKKSKRISVQ